jgi:hypothetical protein
MYRERCGHLERVGTVVKGGHSGRGWPQKGVGTVKEGGYNEKGWEHQKRACT